MTRASARVTFVALNGSSDCLQPELRSGDAISHRRSAPYGESRSLDPGGPRVRLIVADAYGYGVRSNSEAEAHELTPDQWTEIDARDEVVATFGDVVVRYRDNGREVVVPAGSAYKIEFDNPDVIDVRTAETTVDELVEAMGGSHVHSQRVLDVLHAVHVGSKIEELQEAYEGRTGVPLEDALREKLTGHDLREALALLGIV